jgi:hypothetical protein
VNDRILTDILQTIADWRAELQSKIDSAEHTVPPGPFKALRGRGGHVQTCVLCARRLDAT